MIEIGFENTYFQVFQGFPALNKETVAHIQPNGQFWTVFRQNGQNGIFFKKVLGTFLSRLQALTNCKVSEKINELFSSNRVTHACTHARTDDRESLGLHRLRRETKKPPLLGILAKNGPFWKFLAKMGETGFFSNRHAMLGLSNNLDLI